jgi:prolyl oligopeptidase
MRGKTRLQLLFIAVTGCSGIGLLHGAASIAADDAPSPPRTEPFVETRQGVEIHDPYRWMEAGGPEFDALARAEDAYARRTLAALPDHAAWQRRVQELGADAPWFGDPQHGGNRTLLTTIRVDRPVPEFTVMTGNSRRPLPDLARIHDRSGRHVVVPHSLVLSPDGRWLTVGMTRDGESDPLLRVYDLDQGRYTPETVKLPLFADARGFRPRWVADSSGFYYVRNPQRSASTPEVEREWRGHVYLHRLGQPVAKDTLVFGHDLEPSIAPDDTLYVEGPPTADWLVLYNRRPQDRELWAAPIARDGRPTGPFQRLLRVPTAPGGWGVTGDHLRALRPSAAGAVDVVEVSLRDPAAEPRVILPAGDMPWSQMAVAADATYLVRRDGAAMSLHRLDRADKLAPIELPLVGAMDSLQPLPNGGVELRLDTWLEPSQWVRVAADATRGVDTGLMPAVGPDASAYVTERLLADARDGEQVPVTLLRRRDLPFDARTPTILYAYGCYGTALDAGFRPEILAWLERGGMYAIAHVRGGGDLGPRWQLAGRDRAKPTTIEDIIDVAAHLVRTGRTGPGRIAGESRSCGGLTVGRAALERPDLFGAALLNVGHLDATRDNDASYRRSIYDIGDPDTSTGVRRMRQLSPYHSILPGAPTPAFLLLNGANDYTIPLWHGTKFVARVRADGAGDRPALLRVNWSGGHKLSATADDGLLQELADSFTFAWWQLVQR